MYAATVNCDSSTNTSVLFSWDSIAGASNYQVSVSNGPFVAPSGSFHHFIGGMTPGDTLSLRVRTIGNSLCGDVYISDSVQCVAVPCSPLDFDIDGSTTQCGSDSLSFEISNASSGLIGVDFGNGFASNLENTLHFGEDTLYTITVIDSNQLACAPQSKTLEINVIDVPNISLNALSTFPVCEDQSVVFSATPAQYLECWSFTTNSTYFNTLDHLFY